MKLCNIIDLELGNNKKIKTLWLRGEEEGVEKD